MSVWKFGDWSSYIGPGTFVNGDVVMVCKHIYEQSPCRVVQNANVLRAELRLGGSVSLRFSPRQEFVREDGTHGPFDFTVKCAACYRVDEREVDYIEQHWQDGVLKVADFAREVA